MDALGALISGGLRPDAARRPEPVAADRVTNERAAKDMEALFVTQLLTAMRKTVPESGLLSGGRGEEVMRSLRDEAMAQAIAERGGLGFAEALLGQLGRINPEGGEGGAEPR